MHLSFLNANWYRKYPFRASAGLVATNGTILPNDLIVGCRLVVDHDNLDVNISKVCIQNGIVTIEFATSTTALGVASARITQDNQAVAINSLIPTFSGFVIIGNKDTAQVDNSYIFTADNGKLEPSVISVFVPPTLTKIVHNNVSVTGKVTLSGEGLILNTSGDTVSFTVLAPQDVASRKDNTSALLTCANPVIAGINTVSPVFNGTTNNIDFYGIDPVKITVEAGRITITTDKTVTEVCKALNIPPIDTSDQAHNDIATATSPEWKSWNQFGTFDL